MPAAMVRIIGRINRRHRYSSPKKYRQAHPLAPRSADGLPLDYAPIGDELIGVRHFDPLGPVRKSPSDETYQRLVPESSWNHAERIRDSRAVGSLVSRGMINRFTLGMPQWDSAYRSEIRYLNSPELQIPMQPSDWTSETRLQVAELWLAINQGLLADNLALIDAHSGNIAFDNKMHPVLIDHGSIVELTKPMVGIREFLETQLWPLILMTGMPELHAKLRPLSLSHSAYSELRPIASNLEFVVTRLLLRYCRISDRAKRFSSKALARLIPKRRQQQPLPSAAIGRRKVLNLLVRRLRALRRGVGKSGFWSDYRGVNDDGSDAHLSTRDRAIISEARSLEWFSCLDVGANDGHHVARLSESVEEHRQFTVSDIDDYSVSKFVRRVQNMPTDHSFAALVSDFFSEFRKHDLVLALALTHHLALQQGYPFDAIARQLARISGRYCIVEFMPFGLTTDAQISSGKNRPVPDWYSEANFLEALGRHFVSVKVFHVAQFESASLPHRVAILTQH